MSAQGTYRFYSVLRQTIVLVTGEPLGQERVNLLCMHLYMGMNTQITAVYSENKQAYKYVLFYF